MKIRNSVSAVIVSMIVLLAICLTPLSPIVQSVNAQTTARNRVITSSEELSPAQLRKLSPDDPLYYNSPNVRYLATNYHGPQRADFTYLVGSSPQIRGGARTNPQPDEEDVPNDRVRDIETMSGGGTLSIVRLPLTTPDRDKNGNIKLGKDGKQIMVPVIIRQKKDGKLLLVIICSNWSREVGFRPPPSKVEEPCTINLFPTGIPGKYVDPTDGKMKDGLMYDFNCGKVTYTFQPPSVTCPDCVPGKLFEPVIQKGWGNDNPTESAIGNRNGMQTQEFTIESAIRERYFGKEAQDLINQLERQMPDSTKVVVSEFFLEIDPCPVNTVHQVHFLARAVDDKHQTPNVRKHHWGKILKWIFWIAVGVVGAIILIKVLDHNTLKKITPITPRIPPGGMSWLVLNPADSPASLLFSS